jgi:hypothetical protein
VQERTGIPSARGFSCSLQPAQGDFIGWAMSCGQRCRALVVEIGLALLPVSRGLNPRLADPPPPSGLGFILGNPLLMNVHSAAAGDGSCDNTTIASGARQLFQPSDTPCRTPQSPMQTDLNSHPHRT